MSILLKEHISIYIKAIMSLSLCLSGCRVFGFVIQFTIAGNVHDIWGGGEALREMKYNNI